MKKLKNFAEEIHKCSKCALCQAVCPEYLKTHNECDCIKGKFIMLEGVLKGDIKPDKAILSYLKVCVGCDMCKNACPAGINIPEIINVVVNELERVL